MQLALCGRYKPLFCKIWPVFWHNETQPFCISTLCLTTTCCLQTKGKINKGMKLTGTNNLHVWVHTEMHNDYNPLRQVLFRAAATWLSGLQKRLNGRSPLRTIATHWIMRGAGVTPQAFGTMMQPQTMPRHSLGLFHKFQSCKENAEWFLKWFKTKK